MNLQELCLPNEEKTHDSLHVNTTATIASRVSSSPELRQSSVPVMSHAIAEGSDRSTQGNSAECGGKFEVSTGHPDESTGVNAIGSKIARSLRQPGSPSRWIQPVHYTLVSDDEFEHVDLAELPMAETSPPRRGRASVASQRATPTRAMGSHQTPAPSLPASYPNDDTVYTTSSPSSCDICAGNSTGSHCPSFGVMGQQAYLGKEACFEVYESDPGYIDWIRARASSLTPAMSDFLMYCQAREGMERGIHQ